MVSNQDKRPTGDVDAEDDAYSPPKLEHQTKIVRVPEFGVWSIVDPHQTYIGYASLGDGPIFR